LWVTKPRGHGVSFLNAARAFSSILLLITLYLLTAAAALADTSNKWRIKVDGSANSSAEMIFHATPKNAETLVVRVTVKDGTGENRVARTIRDAFKVQMPSDRVAILSRDEVLTTHDTLL
jgi:hypothetical protein